MALIKCYECSKEISDKAPACPHCGAPKQEAPEEQAAGLEVEAADKAAAAKKGSAGNAVRDYIQELISRSRQ